MPSLIKSNDLYSEDGGNMFLQNIGNLYHHYTPPTQKKVSGSGYGLYDWDLIPNMGMDFSLTVISELVMNPTKLAIQWIQMVFTWR
jgi:hypothetical protein